MVFALALWLVRSQTTVDDEEYMAAMIPHHSIAVMTSSRANISDPRVRKLADSIIAAQNKEIAEMKYLIAHPGEGGEPVPARSGGEPAPVASVGEALSQVRAETLDAEAMTAALGTPWAALAETEAGGGGDKRRGRRRRG